MSRHIRTYTSFCGECRNVLEEDTLQRTCPVCGGIIGIRYELSKISERIDRNTFTSRPPGLWKYSELLPITNPSYIVTLGEGGTPLLKGRRYAERIGLSELYLKDETHNPTGAFIDRGTSVEISKAKEFGISTVLSGTTGNLAASLVAYAARASLKSEIYISKDSRIDIGKLYQILAYGTDVQIVKDARETSHRSAKRKRNSHIVSPSNPWFLEGVKTTAYEILDQLQGSYPDWIVAPMGSGCHLAMIWKAIGEFREIGFIDDSRIGLIGTQAYNCAPIVEGFQAASTMPQLTRESETIAKDIAIRQPTCGHMAIQAIKESEGTAIGVSDEEILDAIADLAKYEGVFAEPASATTIAALKKLVDNRIIDRSDTVICVITGMGLKYPEFTRTLVQDRKELASFLSRREGRHQMKRLGATKAIILQILSTSDSYGYKIWKTLRDDYECEVSIPTVYQHLNELVEDGLITSSRTEQTIRKTVRKFFTITEKGRWALNHLQEIQ